MGEYSFRPFKIVIYSFYKDLIFSKIGCYQEKPIILDDTCYILQILNSSVAKKFLDSLIFSDNKRLITTSLLNRDRTLFRQRKRI